MRPLVFVFLGLLLLLTTGCGPQATKARHLKKADAYFAEGNFEAAELEYRNALRAVPLDGHSIGRLGLLYFEQGRQLRAYSFLIKGTELQPDNLDLRLKLAALQFASRKLAEARATALAVLEKRPGDTDAPLLLAESASQPGEFLAARDRLQALPKPHNEGAPALVGLGVLEFRQRKLAEAEELFQKALRANPKSSDAHSALGMLHVARKEPAKAEAAFKAAADLSPARSPKRLQYAQFKLQNDAKAGRELLENLAKQAPDFIPGLMALAQLAVAENKPDEALAHLAKITARETAHPEALLLIGRLRLAKGEVDRAVSELEKTVGIFATLPQAHYELGQAYVAKGDISRASASFAQAVSIAPNFTEAVVAQAGLQVRKGELAPAIAALQKVVQQRPDFLPARSILADALRQQGKPADAIAVYEATEKVFPRLPTAPHLRGMLLLQQRKPAEARRAFERALEVGPTYYPAVEQLAALDMREKKPDDARARVEAFIARTPKSADGYVLLAQVLIAQKDNRMAETALQRAISVQPEAPAPYLALARMQVANQNAAQAITNLQSVLARSPGNAEALMMLSALYQRQNDHAAARDTYEKLVAVNPRFGVAYNNLAYLYSEHFNQLEKALEMAQRARELLPLDPSVADTLGWILYKRKQYGPALTLLQEAAEKLPQVAEVHFHLGLTHYMLGEEAAARNALQKALELQPDFAGNAEAKARLVMLGGDATALGVDPKAALERAAAERKDDPVALARLAQIYEKERAYDKALAAYESALAASPQNTGVMLGLSRTLAARNENARAIEVARAARKIAPDDPDIAVLLGRLAVQTGQHSWALSLFQEAARKKPDAAEVHYEVAEASLLVGRAPEALASMRKALALGSDFPHVARARVFTTLVESLGQPPAPELAATITAALKANPQDAAALLASGSAQVAQRDFAGARQTYERVLAAYPDLMLARRHLAVLAARQAGAEDRKALEYAVKAREVFPEDAELAKALGVLTYRQGNASRAIVLLQEAVAKRAQDAEAFFYLGLARHKQKDRNGAKQALQSALDLQLPAELAAEARKVLGELK